VTTFLDIGVVRVQRYIGRWPQLRGRRGASALVSTVLDTGHLSAVIKNRARTNPAAGSVDGVLSLEVIAGDPASLAADLIAEIRGLMPAAELEATWADGDDYWIAYAQIAARRSRGDCIVSLPLSSGFPLLKICDLCAMDPAVISLRVIDEQRDACADCAARCEQPNVSPIERRLTDATGLKIATDFNHLAELGFDSKRNHLATVYADGNAFGAFFAALLKSGLAKDGVSAQLNEATWTALIEAAELISQDSQICRVLPHVVGGDDVLVSVPASHAWLFTRTYLQRFNELTAAAVAELGDPSLPAPTASASIVLAHSSWPFNAAADLAADLLARAKRVGAGTVSTIGWLEVTRRGTNIGDALPPIALETLNDWAPNIGRIITDLTSTVRYTFEQQLDGNDPSSAMLEVKTTANRLGYTSLVFPEQSPTWDLRSALDIARWWSHS